MEQQLEVRARELAERFWDRVVDAEGVRLFEGGSTPTTFLVRSGPDQIVVKIGNPTIEVEAHQKLSPFLANRLPRLLKVGSDYLIREYIRGVSLRLLLTRRDLEPTKILAVLREVRGSLYEVWCQTLRMESSLPAPNVLRKWSFYTQLLAQFVPLDTPIRLGQRQPREGSITVSAILEMIQDHYRQPITPTCITHGQPFSGNIIVDPEGRWCLIDPWSNTTDWVEDLARLGRLHSYITAESLSGSLVKTDSRLDLNYTANYPSWVSDWAEEVREFGASVGLEFQDRDWERRYLIARLFGFLREVTYPGRDREHLAPPAAALVALGQAHSLYERLRLFP